jgi:hypothetical protein
MAVPIYRDINDLVHISAAAVAVLIRLVGAVEDVGSLCVGAAAVEGVLDCAHC